MILDIGPLLNSILLGATNKVNEYMEPDSYILWPKMLFISGRSVLIRSHLNPFVFPIHGFPNHRIGEVQARLGLMLMDKLDKLAAAALEILKPPNFAVQG